MLTITHDIHLNGETWEKILWDTIERTGKSTFHINAYTCVHESNKYDLLVKALELSRTREVCIHTGVQFYPGQYGPCGCSDDYNDEVCEYHRYAYHGDISVAECFCSAKIGILCDYHRTF